MKIKIIKCSNEQYWYKNQIGNILEVGEYNRYNYEMYLVPESNVVLYINKDDCELVREVYHSIEEFNKLSELFKNMTPEEYKKLYDESHNKPKVRIPDESTPVDTLVRIRESEACSWSICYFNKIVDDGFQVFVGGTTSKTNYIPNFKTMTFKQCEIVEETLEEKRKRIFHKFVPEEYKWYAIDPKGDAYYYKNKPMISKGSTSFWRNDTSYHLHAGFADPYDWENSLIGREG